MATTLSTMVSITTALRVCRRSRKVNKAAEDNFIFTDFTAASSSARFYCAEATPEVTHVHII